MRHLSLRISSRITRLRLDPDCCKLDPTRCIVLLGAGIAFLLLFRPSTALVALGQYDDRCYLESLYRLIALPDIGCYADYYLPGTALVWLPLGIMGRFAAWMTHSDPHRWMLALTGLSGFLYWTLAAMIIERLVRNSVRSIGLWSVLFLLSVPVLMNVFVIPRSPHPTELLIAGGAVLSLRYSKYFLATSLVGLMFLIRPNGAPLVLLLIGSLLDQYLSKKAGGKDLRREKYFLWVMAAASVPLGIYLLQMAFISGYGGTSFLHRVLGTITPTLFLRYLFTWSDGFLWSHPWWVLVLIEGIRKLPHLSWMSRGAILWMLLQLAVAIGWDGATPDAVRLMSRYFVGTYVAALVVWLELMRAPSRLFVGLSACFLTWESLRNIIHVWGSTSRFAIHTSELVDGTWIDRDIRDIPRLLLGYLKLLGVSPLAFTAYSWMPDAKIFSLLGRPTSAPLTQPALGILTLVNAGVGGGCIALFVKLRKEKRRKDGVNNSR